MFVVIFGYLYVFMILEYVVYLWVEGVDDIWFYLWFLVFMGFVILGLSDFVELVMWVGVLVMMLNVFFGFVIFGFLVFVLVSMFVWWV